MARKKALSQEALARKRGEADRIIEELKKLPPLSPHKLVAQGSDSQQYTNLPSLGNSITYYGGTYATKGANTWQIPSGGTFQWDSVFKPDPKGPTLGAIEGLRAFFDHEGVQEGAAVKEKPVEPPPTYSLKGWLWGVEHTIADIEFDESPIEAVIRAVFGVDAPEEEIITVLVRKADGSTEIRAVEK